MITYFKYNHKYHIVHHYRSGLDDTVEILVRDFTDSRECARVAKATAVLFNEPFVKSYSYSDEEMKQLYKGEKLILDLYTHLYGFTY